MVECDFASEHLPDDSDKLAGAVPQSIVVRPVFRSLGIVISLESCIVFYNIMSSIHKGIAKYRRATFGHPGFGCLKVSRLINGWIQPGECKQLLGFRETMDIANLAKNHSTIHGINSGNGHNYRVQAGDDVCHLQLCRKYLAIQ